MKIFHPLKKLLSLWRKSAHTEKAFYFPIIIFIILNLSLHNYNYNANFSDLVQECIKVSVESCMLSNCCLFLTGFFWCVVKQFFCHNIMKCNIVFKSVLFRCHASFICPDECNMFFLIFSKTNSLQEHPVSFALVRRLQNKRNCFKSESLKIINNCMIPSLYSLNLKSKYH